MIEFFLRKFWNVIGLVLAAFWRDKYLLLAFLSVPASFYYYTQNANVRLRCHVPSWRWPDHFIFEAGPYLFIAVTLAISWWFSVRAMRSTSSIGQTLMIVGLAFEYSVFLFAIIYFQYGLSRTYTKEELFVANAYVNSQVMDGQRFLYDKLAPTQEPDLGEDQSNEEAPRVSVSQPPWQEGIAPDGILSIGALDIRFSEDAEILLPIESNPWNYLRYSISVALPGVPAPNVAVCPRAAHFQLYQVLWGLVLGLIAIFLIVRINKIADTASKPQPVKPLRDVPVFFKRLPGGHKPDVFGVNLSTVSRGGARSKNIRAVRPRRRLRYRRD